MKRALISLILAGACLAAMPARAAEPGRQRLLMDYGWKFTRGEAKGAEAPAFDDSAWRALDLPHDWSIEGPFSRTEAAGNQGAYLPTGIGWYRKTFRLPPSCQGKQVSIEFDGVYQDSEVWINGHALGKRPFGYISFAYDLTEHLKFDGPNVLAVRVDNSLQTNSRWYSGSGIYRHTWLLVTGKVHVDRWGVVVTTPQVSKDAATVAIMTQVKNEGKNNGKYTVDAELLDKDGKIVNGTELEKRVRSRPAVSGISNPGSWLPSPISGPSMRPTCTACEPRSRIKTASWTSTIRRWGSGRCVSTPTRAF